MSPVFADLQTPSICLFWNDEWTIWQKQWYSHIVLSSCIADDITSMAFPFHLNRGKGRWEECQRILEGASIQRRCLFVNSEPSWLWMKKGRSFQGCHILLEKRGSTNASSNQSERERLCNWLWGCHRVCGLHQLKDFAWDSEQAKWPSWQEIHILTGSRSDWSYS